MVSSHAVTAGDAIVHDRVTQRVACSRDLFLSSVPRVYSGKVPLHYDIGVVCIPRRNYFVKRATISSLLPLG